MGKTKQKKAIAILCADIHLSHRPPIWRSAEPNWYEAMANPLAEIKSMQEEYECPVLCAGDIFDRWKAEPEVINFAHMCLPDNMWAIPGQHDLPEHNYKLLYRSAYRSLLFGKIQHLGTGSRQIDIRPNLIVDGFPFGFEIHPRKSRTKDIFIALVHDYVWTGTHKYPKAPKEAKVETRSSKMINGKLYGYDVIVYGDNHKGFLTKVGKTTIFNCGTLMRRKSDEIDYKPQIGLLYNDGSVEPHYLDISQDKYLTVDEMKDRKQIDDMDLEDFAKELLKLSSSALDFAEAMKQFCRTNKVKKEVQKIIHTAMENEK